MQIFRSVLSKRQLRTDWMGLYVVLTSAKAKCGVTMVAGRGCLFPSSNHVLGAIALDVLDLLVLYIFGSHCDLQDTRILGAY